MPRHTGQTIPLGYHTDCGGTVVYYIYKHPYTHPSGRHRFSIMYRCSRCALISTSLPDLMPVGFRTLHQKTSGHRRPRPRYDLTSWKQAEAFVTHLHQKK